MSHRSLYRYLKPRDVCRLLKEHPSPQRKKDALCVEAGLLGSTFVPLSQYESACKRTVSARLGFVSLHINSHLSTNRRGHSPHQTVARRKPEQVGRAVLDRWLSDWQAEIGVAVADSATARLAEGCARQANTLLDLPGRCLMGDGANIVKPEKGKLQQPICPHSHAEHHRSSWRAPTRASATFQTATAAPATAVHARIEKSCNIG